MMVNFNSNSLEIKSLPVLLTEIDKVMQKDSGIRASFYL
jgi:hypothetical protein